MGDSRKSWRFGFALELVICTLLVSIVSVNALRRMDYLRDETRSHIRMTDVSRTAYVAKNIAEGRGYTTNDLPAALIDFYDEKGKLHDEQWVNADRFPFGAYATAVLYTLTGSTSWEVGILLYNLLTFIGFLVLLYAFTRRVFDDRYAGLGAVTIALLHAYTFQFLYWKDGDMLLLTTACMWGLWRYFAEPAGKTPWSIVVGLGTIYAFVFLARPNLGAPIIVFHAVVSGRRIYRAWRDGDLVPVLKRELAIGGVVFVWCLPFMIHSMSEWGTPLFSANNMYQLPLGTRFGMGTDTWWKYSEPGHPVTLARLYSEESGQLFSKFTTSWIATLKNVLGSHPIELLLACGLFAGLRTRAAADAPDTSKPIRWMALVILVALVANLALLPLYGYQSLSYRHYMGFGAPLLWFGAGRALSLIGERIAPALRRVGDHVRTHIWLYAIGVIVVLIAWNFGAKVGDANRLFARASVYFSRHWLSLLVVLVLMFTYRRVLRPPWFPRIAVLSFLLVYACYRPANDMKRANFVWAPLTEKHWEELRKREGLVSSFALQGEVAWNTERKNIPAPEWPMHIYSFLFEHKLEVEDLYIENAANLVSPADGPFSWAAPGFEGYARLQKWRTLPGYELAYHDEAVRGYAKYKVKPRLKASTVFKLVDRAAVQALMKSPDRIELGDPKNVIYTAHGWSDYVELGGKKAVLATDASMGRYRGDMEGPWENSSATFFIDDRKPTSVRFEIYATHQTQLKFYWNLDLFEYDTPRDRAKHLIGTFDVPSEGWHTVELQIPANVVRKGLNKLGFRAGRLQAVVLCPEAMTDAACRAEIPPRAGKPEDPDGGEGSVRVVRPTGLSAVGVEWMSLAAGALEFRY